MRPGVDGKEKMFFLRSHKRGTGDEAVSASIAMSLPKSCYKEDQVCIAWGSQYSEQIEIITPKSYHIASFVQMAIVSGQKDSSN